jgi:8-oxo-dGTP pyrophosphatase MutT (NUDIX family)
MPNGKVIPEFYVNEYPDWVNIFGLTEEGKVLMVQQYRHGIGEVGIELPGGVTEEGETPQQAVKREALEETGYEFEEVIYLGKISANPSTTNNFLHMFVAKGGKKIADQKLDDTEDVKVLHLTIDEVKNLVKEHKMMQSLHVNNILYALHHLGHLNY